MKEIKNVEDYINRIKQIPHIPGFNLLSVPIHYRGESKKNLSIIASVFRYDGDNDIKNYVDKHDFEIALIQKSILEYPNIFINCPNMLEKLVMMQHLSLPTRLIDVTSNPLVALYFACEKDFNDDGKVYYMQQEYTDYTTVEYLAHLIAIDRDVCMIKELVDVLIQNGVNNINKEYLAMHLFRIVTKNFLFKAPYVNDRIRNQRGALIFSALLNPDDKSDYDRLLKGQDIGITIDDMMFRYLGVSVDNMFNKDVITIPCQYKESILKELEKYGIDEAFIYPDPEHQMKSVARYCKNIEHWEIDLGE